MERLFEVIYEDADLLVINKPAGLVCHPTKGDQYSSLISRVRLYLGNGVSSHLVNRLDRETSGVTIVAKNSAVAGELGKLWESRAVKKEYLAIVHGHVRADHGLIDAPLGRDETSIIAVKDCVRPDGRPSLTEFHVVKRFFRSADCQSADLSTLGKCERGCLSETKAKPEGPTERERRSQSPNGIRQIAVRGQDSETSQRSNTHEPATFTLLRIIPHTGRKHQIRIHLSHIGHAIVGDKLYGADEDFYLALAQGRLTDEQRRHLILPNQALHASELTFTWREKPTTFLATPEATFTDFFQPNAPDRAA
jgi:23S rRNA pseudouridine1911/1915/1917 synthase